MTDFFRDSVFSDVESVEPCLQKQNSNVPAIVGRRRAYMYIHLHIDVHAFLNTSFISAVRSSKIIFLEKRLEENKAANQKRLTFDMFENGGCFKNTLLVATPNLDNVGVFSRQQKHQAKKRKKKTGKEARKKRSKKEGVRKGFEKKDVKREEKESKK